MGVGEKGAKGKAKCRLAERCDELNNYEICKRNMDGKTWSTVACSDTWL